MIICDLSFDLEDPDLPGFSMDEVDYFYDPSRRARVSLRRNLFTGNFEVYRRFDDGRQETLETGSLGVCIGYADGLFNLRPGMSKEPDRICEHAGKVRALDCPKYRVVLKGARA